MSCVQVIVLEVIPFLHLEECAQGMEMGSSLSVGGNFSGMTFPDAIFMYFA
jgi:hypothetical protein